MESKTTSIIPREKLTRVIYLTAELQYTLLALAHDESDALSFTRENRMKQLKQGTFWDLLDNDEDLVHLVSNMLNSGTVLSLEESSKEYSQARTLEREGVLTHAVDGCPTPRFAFESELFLKETLPGPSLIHDFKQNEPLRKLYQMVLNQHYQGK